MRKTMIAGVVLAGLLGCAPAMAQRGAQGPMTRDESAAVQKQRFAEMDANKDGIVTREEMSAQMVARMGQTPPPNALDIMFAAMDTDGDGKATADEAAAAAAARFTKFDTDHDGILTPEERRAGMQIIRPQ
jgi:mannose/cellobiose epimerase-like protein (N-acyl-D-glucosamine 2-epimerase family)